MMTQIVIALSTVKDGSLMNRLDPKDAEVMQHRQQFFQHIGIPIHDTTHLQVNARVRDKLEHEANFCRYQIITAADKGRGMDDDSTGFPVDAIVTTESDHALFLPIADCIGAVLYDEEHHVLMLSHLGRQSLEQHGGQKSVEFLVKEFGSSPTSLKVWLTPAASKENYPIWALDDQGMKEVALKQLAAAGIQSDNLTDNPAETDKDPRYFSYTNFFNGRQEVDGDHAIVAMMKG